MAQRTYSGLIPDDLVQKADSVNLMQLAEAYGYQLADGGSKAMKARHSAGLYFFRDNNVFYHHGTGRKGGAISFVMWQENLSFRDAVDKLLGSPIARSLAQRKPVVSGEKEVMQLPCKADSNAAAYDYLVHARGIDGYIVSLLMKQNRIYQTKFHDRCAFVGHDEKGAPKYCSMRATHPDDAMQKSDKKYSDKSYPFQMPGQNRRLFVMESPIDCMSHATLSLLHGYNWQYDHRISLGCLSDAALERYLGWHDIREICFALDNDMNGKMPDGTPCNWGQVAADQFIIKYRNRGFTASKVTPVGKDFNEDLLSLIELEADIRHEMPHIQEI